MNDMKIGSAVAKVAELTWKCHISSSIFGLVASKFRLGAVWLYFMVKAIIMLVPSFDFGPIADA